MKANSKSFSNMLDANPPRFDIPSGSLEGSTINRAIFSAVVIIGASTFGVKLVATAKDLLVASWLGTGDALEAFLLAFVFPFFVINVIAGSFQASLVPILVKVREEAGPEAVRQLFNEVLGLGLLLLCAMMVALLCLAPSGIPLLGSGFSIQKLALTTQLFYWAAPSVVISGLSMLIAAALNAEKRFTLTAIVPLAVPAAAIVAVLALGDSMGIFALALGTLVGFTLELVVMIGAAIKSGLAPWPRWPNRSPEVRLVLGQYLPMVAGASLLSATTLVEQAFAASLPAGNVAALGYSNKLVSLIVGIGAMAIGTAVLPFFSKLVAAADWAQLRQTLRTFSGIIVAASIPLALAIALASVPLIRLIYERGAFTPVDTVQVASIQSIYAIQVPFYLVSILIVRLLSSLRSNETLLASAAISLFLNVTLNLVLVSRIGIIGIAVTSVVTTIITLAFQMFILHKKIGFAK
jgi:putative peptidoglycan lipid II flippase